MGQIRYDRTNSNVRRGLIRFGRDMIDINQFGSFGGTLVGSGVFGFAIGWFLKKIVKLLLLGLGLILALLAFLQYKGIIDVNWSSLQHQTNDLAISAAHQINATLSQASAHIAQQGMQLDILYPGLGITGFMVGVSAGFLKG